MDDRHSIAYCLSVWVLVICRREAVKLCPQSSAPIPLVWESWTWVTTTCRTQEWSCWLLEWRVHTVNWRLSGQAATRIVPYQSMKSQNYKLLCAVCCGISARLTIQERWRLRDADDLSWSSLYKPARRNNLTAFMSVQSIIMLSLTSFSNCSYYVYTCESIPPIQKLMFTHTISFGMFWSVRHLFCRHIYSSFESLTCKEDLI